MNLDVLYHYMNSTHFLEKVQLHMIQYVLILVEIL